MNRGLLLVVSGPSGAGKGTICKALMQKKSDIHLSVSATTRSPRPGEVDGESYYFISEETFRSMIESGGFIEWACFCQNYYGTPREKVEEQLAAGHDVILEIEVQGAMQVRSKFPEAVFVFVMPPSLDELRNRLSGRGTEQPEVVEERLKTALWEFSNIEKYNYIVLNDDVDKAVDRFIHIIEAEKQRTERNGALIATVKERID
ncbi:MAG: guanylate kinase [Ruminococcaceae bacterium]|nr:guanylate kinase [Oscillospiraceae bacterium]